MSVGLRQVGRRTPHRTLYAWTSAEARPEARVRSLLRDRLLGDGIDREQAEVLVLCAGELVANAHEHAPGPYELRLRQLGPDVVLEVHDRGRAIPLVELRPPWPMTRTLEPCDRLDELVALFQERGRGLQLVAQLTGYCLGFRRTPLGKAAWVAVSVGRSA